MTERVVHTLEAVEIEHQDREAVAAITHARKGLIRLFDEQRTIGKASQRVVARQVGKLGFGTLLRGDVLMNFDQPRSLIDCRFTETMRPSLSFSTVHASGRAISPSMLVTRLSTLIGKLPEA